MNRIMVIVNYSCKSYHTAVTVKRSVENKYIVLNKDYPCKKCRKKKPGN